MKKTIIKTKPTMQEQEFVSLKAEIRYFKGMTVLLLVMLLVIFFTFSALFASMYAETRATNEALIAAYNELIVQ